MRRDHLLLGLAGLAVLGAVTLTVTTCAPPPQRPALAPSPPAGTPPIATQTGPFDAGPVRPPAAGVLLGAWVKPSVFTQPARIDAVSAFESALGRRLDIVNTYRRFDEAFPTLSGKGFAQSGPILVLSWAIDDTRVITSGTPDPAGHARAPRGPHLCHPNP